MVLTVTINPLLERNLFFKEIEKWNNRAYNESYSAGGKGINISRQLNQFGIQNQALIFLGGSNGKRLRSILESENINFSAVSTKSETREATLVYDDKNEKLTTYFGVNHEPSSEEINNFVDRLEKAIVNSSTVVFAGSLPNLESAAIFKKGIEICTKHDKISILDTYGEKLSTLIKLGPTVLHNNINEIENSLNIALDSEENIMHTLNNFYNNGVKLSFLTDGASSTYASKSDFHYKINNPVIKEVNPTGSGDAFVSGIIYGLEKSLVFNDFVKLASALGAANASSWDVCKVDYEKAMSFTSKVSIDEIGKKIKLINDSPTI